MGVAKAAARECREWADALKDAADTLGALRKWCGMATKGYYVSVSCGSTLGDRVWFSSSVRRGPLLIAHGMMAETFPRAIDMAEEAIDRHKP